MSKFCMYCGAEMEDNANLCPSCGANQANIDITDAPAQAAGSPSKTKPVIIAVLSVAVIVILLILKAIFGGSYKDPVDNVCRAMETGKGKYIYRCMPEFVLKEEFEDMKKGEIIDKFDDSAEGVLESLEKTFGDDIEVTYKIKNKKKIDGDVIDDLEDDLEDDYDKHIKINKGYELKVKLKIKGDDNHSSSTMNLKVYKVDGKWCFLSTDVNNIFK